MTSWIIKTFFADRGTKRLLWAALALSILISGWSALTSYDMSSVFVRVSMKSPVTGTAVLYYDIGRQFNSVHVSTSPVYGDSKFRNVRLRIPYTERLFNLRLDPPETPAGEIAINRLDIVDHHGNVLHRFKLEDIKPANQIQGFSLVDGEVRFSTSEKANDPQLRISIERPVSFNRLKLYAFMLAYQIIPQFLIVFLVFVLLIFIWSRWSDPVVAFMMILAILLAGWMLYHDFQSIYFQLTMKSTMRGDIAELYYDQGYGFSGASSLRAHVHEDDQFHEYHFKIPRNIRYLRFDPSMKAGTVIIKKMELTDRFGSVLQSFQPHQLSPSWEIKAFEFTADGLTVRTTDKATDSQIMIMLDESWQSHARPLLIVATRALIEWSAIIALLLIFIFLWNKNRERAYRFIDGAFVQERLPLIYLGCAFGLILAMVFIGNRTCHPDEWSHIYSANFYSSYWLPKSVDNPEVVKTISGYGTSYLFRVEIAYWLAGKLSSLLSALIYEDYLRLRLLNTALFLFCVLLWAWKARKVPLFSMALIVSPQIWYMFSYFNGDGFPFFVSLLISWQLVDHNSMTNQYLNSADFRKHISGGILFGILMGLMLLSKMNYYIYIAFILCVMAWRFLFESRGQESISERNRLQIKKAFLIVCIALFVWLPHVVYDQYVNDFRKNEKILITAERHAHPALKPSKLRDDISSSYPGLRLRDKGMSLRELLFQNPEWRDMTFKSFFGLYGNMDYHSDRDYYQVVRYTQGAFFLLIFFCVIIAFPIRDVVMILIVILFAGLAIGQSVYHSWVNDYQPQGRYLFVILPMLVIGLDRLPDRFRTRIIPIFSLIFFFLSASSFLWTAIRHIPKLSGCG